MAAASSIAYQLADVLWADRYGYPLGDWVAERREQGSSWRHISEEIKARTSVEITHATLINWFPQLKGDQVAAA